MRIAMVGTRGVPATYGGFETAVDEVGRRLVQRGHEVVVYCRTSPGSATERPATHLGMELVHLPAARKRALETLSHTALSVAHLIAHRTDAAFVFNAANAPLLPVLRAARVPVATHVDGLEWKRTKWSGAGRRYYRTAEALAVRWSDALISDAQGIADYYTEEFGAPTDLITYGAPQIDPPADRLAELGLTARGYHLVVARFEPENHVREIVAGYVASRATHPLVVVGSAPYADEYTAQVHGLGDDRVRFLGGIWDQDLLDVLYAHATTYVHGHSVGGTNPSLLRAIGAAATVLAYDVSFNREVLGASGRYFSTPADLPGLVLRAETDPENARRRGVQALERAATYDWDVVAAAYEDLAFRLADRSFPRRRPAGRRLRRSAPPALPTVRTDGVPVDLRPVA